MKIIQTLARDIKTELEDAEHYVNRAVESKNMYPKISEMYSNLAKGELEDAMNLHKFAVSEIEESRKTETPPAYMLEMWAEEHKEMLERASKVKYSLEMLREK